MVKKSFLVFTGLVFIGIIIGSVQSWESHGERCEISGSGSDSCDPSKYLQCVSSRCQCQDLKHQHYSSVKVEILPRSKRSPGKKKKGGIGGGTAVLGGVAAAAGGAYVGHKISKAVSKQNKKEFMKVYSCFSLVESPCVLDGNRYSPSDAQMTTSTTTTTTQAPSSTVAPAAGNMTGDLGFVSTSSTTSAPPSSSSSLTSLDRNKLPNCVEFAVCRPVHRKYDDSRIGECSCTDGYKKNSKDLCVKSSGSSKISLNYFILLIILPFFTNYL